jgi:hypothetical protein
VRDFPKLYFLSGLHTSWIFYCKFSLDLLLFFFFFSKNDGWLLRASA